MLIARLRNRTFPPSRPSASALGVPLGLGVTLFGLIRPPCSRDRPCGKPRSQGPPFHSLEQVSGDLARRKTLASVAVPVWAVSRGLVRPAVRGCAGSLFDGPGGTVADLGEPLGLPDLCLRLPRCRLRYTLRFGCWALGFAEPAGYRHDSRGTAIRVPCFCVVSFLVAAAVAAASTVQPDAWRGARDPGHTVRCI